MIQTERNSAKKSELEIDRKHNIGNYIETEKKKETPNEDKS